MSTALAASKLLRSSSTPLHTLLRRHLLRPATISAPITIPYTPPKENLSENGTFFQLKGQTSPIGLLTAIEYANLNIRCRGKDYEKSTAVNEEEYDDDVDEDEDDFGDGSGSDEDGDWDEPESHLDGSDSE